jgi:uncharacterized protein YyaL (SSP411 family)
LREHGHDPIDWRPWGEEAIALAVAEDKPIFLSIGYSSCHFCHVMHDEVFSKDDVAAVLNERFIAIKVDREERPDLDATFLDALSQFGSAGWPASLFLTPSLDPYFGATYVPHDRFLAACTRAADVYRDREGGKLSPLRLDELRTDARLAAGTALSEDELRAMAADAVAQTDMIQGGVKGAMKFPMSPRLAFLLHAARKWNVEKLADALRVTLDAMMKGALRDPISGGFHRYTTDAAWSTPHYEMMLYDNAQLASVYAEAAVVLGEPRYLDVARGVLDFMAASMTTDSGAFAASFDADTRGEEGAAWRWSAPEVTKVVGAEDAPIVVALLGLGSEKIAPTFRASFDDVATRTKSTRAAVEAAWSRARPALLGARKGVALRDDKVVAAWNALAIGAFARGFVATGDARYRDAAVRAGEAWWRDLHEAKGALTRVPGGGEAFSEDYGDGALAFVDLFGATSDPRWLARADALLAESKALESKDGGGLRRGKSNLAQSVATEDLTEPSGTAAMLHARALRDAIAPDDAHRAVMERAFTAHGNALRAQKLSSAAWLDAALLWTSPRYDVVIAGADADAAPLVAVNATLLAPWAVTVRIPADGAPPPLLAAVPSLADKKAGGARAKAFVCERTSCMTPATNAATLREQMLRGWVR